MGRAQQGTCALMRGLGRPGTCAARPGQTHGRPVRPHRGRGKPSRPGTAPSARGAGLVCSRATYARRRAGARAWPSQFPTVPVRWSAARRFGGALARASRSFAPRSAICRPMALARLHPGRCAAALHPRDAASSPRRAPPRRMRIVPPPAAPGRPWRRRSARADAALLGRLDRAVGACPIPQGPTVASPQGRTNLQPEGRRPSPRRHRPGRRLGLSQRRLETERLQPTGALPHLDRCAFLLLAVRVQPGLRTGQSLCP